MLNQIIGANESRPTPQFQKLFVSLDPLEYALILDSIEVYKALLPKIIDDDCKTEVEIILGQLELLHARLTYIVTAEAIQESAKIMLKKLEDGKYNPQP
jgi:hypothetical protein